MAELADSIVRVVRARESENIPRLASVLSEGMDNALSLLRAGQTGVLLTSSFRETVVRTLTDLHRDAISDIVFLMQKEFQEGFKGLELKNETTQILQQYIDSFGARSAAQIIHTTERQLVDLVNGGLAQGEAMESIYARLINKVPQIAEGRATVISATEAHSATQFASQRMAERSQIALKKVWNTVLDERTRDFFGTIDEFNHRIMNGRRTALEGSFAVPRKDGTLELLQFPGDPNGSPGNIINCRCVQTYERVLHV